MKKSESTLSLGFERLEKCIWIRFFSAIAPIKIMMNCAILPISNRILYLCFEEVLASLNAQPKRAFLKSLNCSSMLILKA